MRHKLVPPFLVLALASASATWGEEASGLCFRVLSGAKGGIAVITEKWKAEELARQEACAGQIWLLPDQ